MNTFDPYTRNVITNVLLKEQSAAASPAQTPNLPPQKPKKGQKYRTKDGRNFVWNGSFWQRVTSQSAKQTQGGVGFAGDVLPPPIKRVKKDGKEEIIPAPPEAILYGLSNVPSGYDPEAQATWVNYYDRANKFLEGLCGGILSNLAAGTLQKGGKLSQVIAGALKAAGMRSAIPDALQIIGKGGESIGNFTAWATSNPTIAAATDYALKQSLRSGLAKSYLGIKDANLDPKSEDYEFQQQLKSFIPGGDVELKTEKGRLGSAGDYYATLIPQLATMGYDPMEYMLNKFGAPQAAQSIANSAAKEADLTMSAGGYLRRGRELGAFK
jgi:hypothetical protein